MGDRGEEEEEQKQEEEREAKELLMDWLLPARRGPSEEVLNP